MTEPCFQITLAGYPIILKKKSKNLYTVTYGKQVSDPLTYEQASNELGYSILHALSCEGKLD